MGSPDLLSDRGKKHKIFFIAGHNDDSLQHLQHSFGRNETIVTTHFSKDELHIFLRYTVVHANVAEDTFQSLRSYASRGLNGRCGTDNVLLEARGDLLCVMLLTVAFQGIAQSIKGHPSVGRQGARLDGGWR